MKSYTNQEQFYRRLRELSNVDAPSKSTELSKQSLIEYTRTTDGTALGVIKEDNSFYLKSSTSSGDIGVEHFTYIGGLENKPKYKYDSLAEAVKKMNSFVGALNEAYSTKYNPARTLNEEKEMVAKSNADKGGIANSQDLADKTSKGETIKNTAKEQEIADPLNKQGIANAQSVGDKNKSDDAGSKIKIEHEASTASGKSREDIAHNQSNGDAEKKGEALKTSAVEKGIDDVLAKTAGNAKAQGEADKNKSNDASANIKKEGHKEVVPASDAKKEKAIVAENFGEENPETQVVDVSSEPAAPAASAEAPAASPVAGDEKADLDAAASALDALDINASAADGVGTAPAASPSAEVPAADGVGAAPVADPNAGAPVAGGDGMGGDDAAVKDIEKLVGKAGQKIRSTELTDEMVGGFLKSIISSFDGKLENLDSELRRELSNKILKAGEEGEASNGAPASGSPVDSTNTDDVASPAAAPAEKPEASNDAPPAEDGEEDVPDDKEIEEAINKHLAVMGKPEEGGVENSGFKKYMSERGYGVSEDISIMEMTSLIGGYMNECTDPKDADMKSIAEFVSPEVSESLTECGYGNVVEGVKMFSIKPKTYKSKEPVVETQEEAEEDKKLDEKKDDFSFAPAGQSLNKAEKEEKKDDDKKEEKEIVSESTESKLSKIIGLKIQEQLGLKKATMNESSKSTFSKQLDKLIAAAINENAELIKKHIAKK